MLWPVTKPVESGLYLLDEIYTNFYTKLFEGNSFDACFSVDFSEVLNASQRTKDLFQSVFDLYRDLDGAHKDSFQEIYDNHSNISQAFSDDSYVIMRPDDEHGDLWTAAKKLGGYLYSTTLGLKCFTDFIEKDCMDDHFKEYKNLNGGVCCFCGTEEMMEERDIISDEDNTEKQWRASYDHYLAKKYYPFLSVNFNNLIPCCHICNEKAKQELDILCHNGERVLVFLPYEDNVPVSLNAKYENCDGIFKMRISINNTADQQYEKTLTWNRIFEVLPRINRRLNRFEKSWLAPVLSHLYNIDDAKSALSLESRKCHESMKDDRESYYKSLCFNYLSTKSDQEILAMIDTVNQIYGNRNI